MAMHVTSEVVKLLMSIYYYCY